MPHYWLVDPEARTLEAYESDDDRWLRLGAWSDGDRVAIPPFDAVEVEIANMFPPVAEA